MVIPPRRSELLDERAEGSRARSRTSTHEGLITDGERYNKVVDIWAGVAEQVAEEMMKEIGKETVDRPGDRREEAQPSLQPDLHHGRLRRPRLARSRSASWPACAA